MSNSTRITTWVIIIIVVVGLFTWYIMSQSASVNAPATAPVVETAPTASSAGSGSTGTGAETAAVANGALTTSASDATDASLNQDMSSIGGGMSSLSADSASANAPVSQ